MPEDENCSFMQFCCFLISGDCGLLFERKSNTCFCFLLEKKKTFFIMFSLSNIINLVKMEHGLIFYLQTNLTVSLYVITFVLVTSIPLNPKWWNSKNWMYDNYLIRTKARLNIYAFVFVLVERNADLISWLQNQFS